MSNTHEITIAEGQAMLDNFKNNAGCVNAVRGVKIEQSIINDLMSQPNAVGIDAYFGLDSSNKMNLVLIAYDNQDNEIASVVMDRLWTIPPRPSGSPFSL